ncbi:TadE/TadG family type IV pilus assembly protein [Qipengyuania aquimaris]|uniref:TadE/TadG family type IV pilus assembly protein n=1 Tax=Qipengyuania aquimaris TaxID=255984 RepID=UPI001FD48250|nr:pilus assembly protein TadG-related protein [Qipengyuania aquimaris]UOR16402.1 pilus assembly protein TadG-related protein [Qipengyuania aquimaris]
MKASNTRRFLSNESGAVAATYALALIPLIAFAGVAFDYARLMGLDSELQNGADQAALAAASQLDGRTGACARASQAAVTMLNNNALLASDDRTVSVTAEAACDATGQIRFFQDKAKATAATSDENANYVEVFVDARRLDYAILPFTGALTGEDLNGIAFAGLGSAICKVPPVMMCNPNESSDPAFTTANYAGHGVRLIANDQGGLYGPGVFGYLETNAGNGAIATARTLGREIPPGDCISTDGADVKPGQQISVLDALNTRVGVYANGLNNVCGQGDDLCPPPANARIDLLKKGGSCAIGNSGFQVGPNPYRPTSPVNDLTASELTGLDPMGFPRDKCHAVSELGSCAQGTMGDGNWDRNAYYTTNGLGSMPTTWSNYGYSELSGRSTPTRYQQYRWEYDQHVAGGGQLTNPSTIPGGYNVQRSPLCNTPGIPPASTPDRRILSIAVINCTAEGVSSSTTDARIEKFVDVFLVEPSARRGSGSNLRTAASDVYVEIIGETVLGGGSDQGQEIRKDVPYLIE